MAVNPNSNIYKGFSSGIQVPTAIPMPNPKETGSEEDDDLRKKNTIRTKYRRSPKSKARRISQSY